MPSKYKPPISVNFIWNPKDSKSVDNILKVTGNALARNVDRPFSRSLNIPLFFFSSSNSTQVPADYPLEIAHHNIVFIFTSTNTLGRFEWKEYIENLPEQSDTFHIVPIAIDQNGYAHKGSLSNLNCIRLNDLSSSNLELHALVSIAHEVYRFGCCDIKTEEQGKLSSIKIFLSHAKAGDTGRILAEKIKNFIDNSNMNRFFDANEISPGYRFDKEIENHIKDATLIAIETDAYSSRYWCQKEILSAKKNDRPILAVNHLDDYEDRIFPAASNIPCVHVSPINTSEDKTDILKILSEAIIETIRFYHATKKLKEFQYVGWIDSDCEIIARPPEIRQILELKSSKTNPDSKIKVCYPEPPIYEDEADWHEQMEVEAFTPLWHRDNKDSLKDHRIGISISDTGIDDFSTKHIHSNQLIRLAQDLSRQLLARSATLVYGGDLRKDGFTEFILDEARILNNRVPDDTRPHVENHLAWPIYLTDEEITAWRAKYSDVMKTVTYLPPEDILSKININEFIVPNTTLNSYIWSRCLTKMREQSIRNSTARICVGGKLSGYKGKMPGVLEEIIIAINEKKPLFLLGAFGGVVGEVCTSLIEGKSTEPLTEAWQKLHNVGYDDLQTHAKSLGQYADYNLLNRTIAETSIKELSSLCNLDEHEYRTLMETPFIDECVHLILKGLNKTKPNH